MKKTCGIIVWLFCLAFSLYGADTSFKEQLDNVKQEFSKKGSVEIIEKRSASSKTFSNKDGSCTYVGFNKKIHEQDKSGSWVEKSSYVDKGQYDEDDPAKRYIDAFLPNTSNELTYSDYAGFDIGTYTIPQSGSGNCRAWMTFSGFNSIPKNSTIYSSELSFSGSGLYYVKAKVGCPGQLPIDPLEAGYYPLWFLQLLPTDENMIGTINTQPIAFNNNAKLNSALMSTINGEKKNHYISFSAIDDQKDNTKINRNSIYTRLTINYIPPPVDKLVITPATLIFNPGPGTQLRSVNIKNESYPNKTFSYTASGIPAWIQLPANSTGPKDFTVKAEEYNGNEQRVATITFTTGIGNETLTITQNPTDGLVVINPTPVIPITGGPVTIKTSNRNPTGASISYQISPVVYSSEASDWLTIASTSGTTPSNVNITATPNSGKKRTATITFTSSFGNCTSVITQIGNQLAITSTPQNIAYNGGSATIKTSNLNPTGPAINYQMSVVYGSGANGWLTLPSTSGTTPSDVIVTATPNTGNQRTATINFTSDYGSCTSGVITQKAGNVDGLEVSKTYIGCPFNAQTNEFRIFNKNLAVNNAITFNINTQVWDAQQKIWVNGAVDWLTLSATTGTTDKTITFSLLPNNSTYLRNTMLLIESSAGNKRVEVKQFTNLFSQPNNGVLTDIGDVDYQGEIKLHQPDKINYTTSISPENQNVVEISPSSVTDYNVMSTDFTLQIKVKKNTTGRMLNTKNVTFAVEYHSPPYYPNPFNGGFHEDFFQDLNIICNKLVTDCYLPADHTAGQLTYGAMNNVEFGDYNLDNANPEKSLEVNAGNKIRFLPGFKALQGSKLTAKIGLAKK